MHAQVHLVLSTNDDSAEIRSFCRFLWGFLVGHFTRFGSTPTNLHTGLGAPRMQHSAQHTPYYNVAAPPCVQADACGGRGPANLHCSLGAGPTLAATWPGSTTARWLWHGWRYHAMASVPCDFSLFKLHFCCRVLKAKKPATMPKPARCGAAWPRCCQGRPRPQAANADLQALYRRMHQPAHMVAQPRCNVECAVHCAACGELQAQCAGSWECFQIA